MEPIEGQEKSLWDELLELYEPEEAEVFLRTPQPFLDGAVPSVEMAKGNFDPIFSWIDGCNGMVAT